jgi:multicomponent Na+:H+ antiporter subunit D
VTPSTIILMAIAAPFIGSILVLLTGKIPNLRESVSTLTTLVTFAIVCTLLPEVMNGGEPGITLIEDVLPGVDIAFHVEPLGMLYALVASGLWIVTSLYAIGYMRAHDEKNQTRFFACFALAIFASLGIAFARNLFTLFLFYEVLTLSTYPLVAHYGEEVKKNARVYLGILIFTSVAFLLAAVCWTYVLTGTLNFERGGILAGKVEGWEIVPLLALFAFGTGKAALMPFHRWLPNAMVAPTPVSALLHAVAVVKAGVFTVMKVVVYVFGIDLLTSTGASIWLMYVASATLLISSCIAITQDNLKARLAYSTISQLAYIVLGAALATSLSIMGGSLHIAMHAVGKITLFFCAGAIYVAHHKKYVSELNGIGKKMPFTMIAFLLGSLSIIGLPPFGGSWSKWYLVVGAADSPGHILMNQWHVQHIMFSAVFMLSSLLSIAYLMPVVIRAFFYSDEEVAASAQHDASHHDGDHDHQEEGDGISEAPLLCVVPLCITALGSLVIFFYTQELYEMLEPITEAVTR